MALKLDELKGSLSDEDFERVGEVWEKQDVYSKSSRKVAVAKIWINRIANYICACLILIALFFGYSIYHHNLKPTPLVFIQHADGNINCARSYSIENNKKIYSYTKEQKNLCISLKKYTK